MLQGQWPGEGCEYCRDVEQAGGISDRVAQLDAQTDPRLTPPELFKDPTATSITPTMMEVYFNNTCNMKCVYCGPHFSSLWEDENRRWGIIPEVAGGHHLSITYAQDNPKYDQMVEDFWKYLDTNNRYRTLQRYHILGGEPFLVKELDQSIDFWDQHPNPNLIFSIISNLNIPHTRFCSYVDRFQHLINDKKIYQLQLTGSLDAWGEQQAYTRFGLDLVSWRENFEYALSKSWIQPSINSALSALTIKQLPVLLEMINEWNQHLPQDRQILHSFNTTGRIDDVYMFGPEIFKEDMEKILDLMPESTPVQQAQKKHMSGIAKRISQSRLSPEKINNLKIYLTKLDQRRGTNWPALFPWLDQEIPVK